MPLRPDLNLRLRQYAPLGDPGAIIPDMGLNLSSTPDGPVLQATLSTVIAGSLPDKCEVAVEVWDSATGAWVEGRDSRFVLNTQGYDARDRTGTVTIQGVGLLQWLAIRAALAGVTPYSDTGNVEAAASSTTVDVSGSTFTWSAHVLGVGDRVRVKSRGSSKGLSTGSVYYVRNPTTSTFQLSHTPTGAILRFGSASNVSLERVKTRIINLDGHQFAKNMAVSVRDAGGSNLTDGSQYYVVNPTASTIQLATKPGGIPIELASNALTVYRYLDGQRIWKSATPGLIIENAFLEARDRGWGVDANGANQIFMSWSAAADSNGYAWPARVDDPTITGVSIGFQPGTSLWDMVLFLVDNGWAEVASQGRTLNLFAPDTGNDYGGTTGTSFVRRVGTNAEQVKIQKDLSEYRTAEIVRGEANVESVVSNADSPWGRLEQYVTASGVISFKHAVSYGKNDLAKRGTAVGYSVTEPAAEALWQPILDYQRGDWLQVQVNGVWTRLRVVQWTLAKDANGVVTTTALFERRKRSLLHKVATASRKANGGRATTTTSTTPHESDKRKAAVPQSLAVTARTVAHPDKSARGTVTATWLPVTTDSDGDDLVGGAYEVVVRAEGEQYGKVVATTTGTTADLHGYAAGQILGVAVRAVSSTGAPGELSDEVEYVVDAAEDVPDAPSTPVVTSTLGSIVIAWDGNLVDATDGPHPPEVADALAYVAVQRSTDGTTWTTEAQTLSGAGSVTDLGLTVGTTYQYRLVAISQSGAASAYSPVASAAVVAIDTAQINAAFTQQVTDASNAASAAQTAASQAETDAGTALSAANGKNRNTYSAAAASAGTPGKVAGDEWFQVDGSGNVIGQWQWNGTAWVTANLTDAVITSLDAGKITTGYLSASRIQAGTLAVTTLAVTDLTNLYPDPTFALTYNTQGALSFPYAGTPAAPKGTAWVVADRDNIGARGQVSVKPGDAFYVEADVRLIQGAATLTAGLWVVTASGGTDPNFAAYGTLNKVEGSGTVFDYGNGWTRRWWRFTIPNTATQVDHGTPYFQVNQTAGQAYSAATAYALGNLVIRRLNSGNLIVDGSITASKIAATAIDAMTITGATFRTASTAKTSGGVQMDSTGLRGYDASGSATFSLDTAGNLSLKGTITAGTITGTVSIASGGKIQIGSGGNSVSIDSNGVRSYSGDGSQVMQMVGGALQMFAGASQYMQADAGGYSTYYSNLTLFGQDGNTRNSGALVVGGDSGGGMVSSATILNRKFSTAQTTPNATDRQVVVIDPNGVIGALGPTGTLFHQQAYSDVISTRAVYTSSSGHFGTTASSKRVKDLHQHLKMDDPALEAWLGLDVWEFSYKEGVNLAPEDRGKRHHGLVAEEVHDAGFTHLIYFEEREDHPHKGRIEGVAYERMGVYNLMAIKRLYARLMEAEKQISALTRKAAA